MRSLAAKLTFAFLLISILGAIMLALLVNWQTRRQFDALINKIYQEDLALEQVQLTAYYQENGSWLGIENIFFEDESAEDINQTLTFESNLPTESDFGKLGRRKLPFMLVNGERQVMFGDRRYKQGETLPATLVKQGLPIEVNGTIVGWVLLDSFGRGGFEGSPEASFLTSLNSLTVWSVLGTAVVGLVLSVLLARTISNPVSELKIATEEMAQGKLGTQVNVHSADEIGQLAISFNQMSADLAKSTELRRQMTADIAHDLRTPLSVIQGYTEALDEGKLLGNSEIYQAIHKQVKHLNRLVEDLRTLSLADAGQLSLHPFSIAPRDLLEHSLLLYAPQAEQKQVALQLHLPQETLPYITVDLDRMTQVLGNLISNALRHTPIGGQIRLEAQRQNQQVLLQVQDTGVGIPQEDLPHVFDRFYRGNKARSESGESGLGLAIARSIVEAHKGSITATSTLNEGTTFTISLPANTQ